MFRIDGDGATVDNKFTEGDPALSVPATVVTDKWLNLVQEEISLFIEAMGITLSDASDTQLMEAILLLHLRGGSIAPLAQDIDNNSGPLDVVGFTFDRTKIQCKKADFVIERKTDSAQVMESGTLHIMYDSKNSLWKVSAPSSIDDTDVSFSVVQVGATDVFQLQYTTDDLAGTTYVGTIKMISIKEFNL